MLTTIVAGLLVFGVVLTGLPLGGVLRGTMDWQELLTQVPLGGVLLFLDVQGCSPWRRSTHGWHESVSAPRSESCSNSASANWPPAGPRFCRRSTPSAAASSAISTTEFNSVWWPWLTADPLARLSPRERSVLEELVQGHTNAAISQKLHVSMSTVEKNLNAIFDKLELAQTTGYNRRILAVLRYLES
ncbi:helix-turn-helix transcriptional regulator [Streptomyces xanthochromogenes]